MSGETSPTVIVGMLSVGEIASTAQGRAAYMNKTIVLGALGTGS